MWSLFGSFWSVKYLNFGQKLPIRIAHHTFLEVDTLRLLKIHIMFCPQKGSQKKLSAHGLTVII